MHAIRFSKTSLLQKIEKQVYENTRKDECLQLKNESTRLGRSEEVKSV